MLWIALTACLVLTRNEFQTAVQMASCHLITAIGHSRVAAEALLSIESIDSGQVRPSLYTTTVWYSGSEANRATCCIYEWICVMHDGAVEYWCRISHAASPTTRQRWAMYRCRILLLFLNTAVSLHAVLCIVTILIYARLKLVRRPSLDGQRQTAS